MTWKFGRKPEDGQGNNDADERRNPTGEDERNGKGRPTPKRREAEQERLRPMVPANRKASAKAARKRIKERENAQYDAMRSGDLAHMPASERLPWRIYIRDYVDARFNVAEFFMPVPFAIIIVAMVLTSISPGLTTIILLLMYVYLFAAIIDVVIMWRRLRKLLVAKFGDRAVAKGSRSATYAWSRCLQIRRWRLPKPTHDKRGHWPE